MAQPALLETRRELLHGQMVEVKVYEPGHAHQCSGAPRCWRCTKAAANEINQAIDSSIGLPIKKRWPVALGIEPGYSEPVSGHPHEVIPCAYNPHPYTPPVVQESKGCRLRDCDRQAHAEAARAFADAAFEDANKLAKERLAEKRRVWQRPWTPAAYDARKAYWRHERDLAEWRKEEDRLREAARARYEAAKIPCSANECEMGDWVKLTHSQFQELLGRGDTPAETREVRGCWHCPHIECRVYPWFSAL